MGLGVYVCAVAIIAITVLLIVCVLSPDNWGRVSAGCNQNCCASFNTEKKASATQFTTSTNNNSTGPETAVTTVCRKSDPYRDIDMHQPIWRRYIQEKEKAMKQKEHFISQSTYIARPFFSKKKQSQIN
jgi:hypothetical protein